MELYSHIVRSQVFATDCLTAEVAKTVENAYRDVNIAFANEVALVCESFGVDVFEVRGFVNNLPNEPANPLTNPVRNMHMPGAGVDPAEARVTVLGYAFLQNSGGTRNTPESNVISIRLCAAPTAHAW